MTIAAFVAIQKGLSCSSSRLAKCRKLRNGLHSQIRSFSNAEGRPRPVIQSAHFDLKTVTKSASQHAKSGNLSGILECFSKLTQVSARPDNVLLNIYLQAVIQKSAVNTAAHMLESIISRRRRQEIPEGLYSVTPNAYNITTIISAFAKVANVDGAKVWFAKFDELKLPPTVVSINNLLLAYSNGGHNISICVDIFETYFLKYNLAPDTNSYNTMLAACARAERADLAVRYFSRMEDHQKRQYDTRPDVKTYSCVIDAFGKNSDSASAESWFQRMVDDGILPNVTVFTCVIHAHARNGNVDRALYWFNRLESDLRIVCKDITTLNMVLDSYAKKGHAEGAQLFLEKYFRERVVRPSLRSYNALIEAHARVGNLSSAVNVFDKMPCKRDTVSYNNIILAAARQSDPETAFYYLNKMQDDKIACDAHSFNVVIHACAEAEQPTLAEESIQRMVRAGLSFSIYTYNAILNAHAKVANAAAALSWFRRLRDDPKVVASVKSHESVFLALTRQQHIEFECDTVLS